MLSKMDLKQAESYFKQAYAREPDLPGLGAEEAEFDNTIRTLGDHGRNISLLFLTDDWNS